MGYSSGVEYHSAGTGYGPGDPQTPDGTVPRGTGGAAPGACGGGGKGYGPENGYGVLGVGFCPPIPGAQGPEDMAHHGPKGLAAAGSVGIPYGLKSTGRDKFGAGCSPVRPETSAVGPG